MLYVNVDFIADLERIGNDTAKALEKPYNLKGALCLNEEKTTHKTLIARKLKKLIEYIFRVPTLYRHRQNIKNTAHFGV